MRVVGVVLFLGAIIIVIGALFFFFARQVDVQQIDFQEPDVEESSQLSSAREITGTWNGKASFTDRALDCSYQGDMVLNLNQNGNNVNGNFVLTVTQASQGDNCLRVGTVFPAFFVAGTIESSSIDMLIANTDDLVGSFTADTMALRSTKCKDCDSGPALILQGPVNLLKER